MRLEEELKATRFQDETHRAQLNILFTAAYIRARIASTLKPHGLSMEQFNVMRILRGAHGAPMLAKDISSRMLERNSNTTRIVDRLEAKGLVQRGTSSRDRRERPVMLTAKGVALLDKIDHSWEAHNPHTAPWTKEEALTVNVLLDKMREP